MADYLTDPDSGQLFVISPAGEPVAIEPADVERIERGGARQIAGAAARGVGTLATGVGALMGVEGMSERLSEFDRQSGIQQQLQPDLALGEFVPDVAAALATGGGSIPAQVAKGVAVEGALGLARTQTLGGAALQATFGGAGSLAGPALGAAYRGVQRPVQSVTGRFKAAADDTIASSRRASALGDIDDSLSAARAGPDSPAFEGDRSLSGMLTPEELRELGDDFSVGAVTTRGDDLALNARNRGQSDAADTARRREELARSSIIGDRAVGGGRDTVSGIRDTQKSLGTDVVARELGQTSDVRLTNKTIIDLKEQNRAAFDEVAEEAGPLNFDEVDKTAISNAVIEGGAQDAAALERMGDSLLKDINDTSHGGSGTLSPRAAQSWRTKLGKDISRALGAGNTIKADALQQMQDVLDEVVERQIPESVSDTLSDARYRFRILLGLERNAATNAGGEINMRSFINGLTKGANKQGESFTRGSIKERMANAAREQAGEAAEETRGGKFMRTLETLDFLGSKVEPDSGTAARLLSAGARAGGIL